MHTACGGTSAHYTATAAAAAARRPEAGAAAAAAAAGSAVVAPDLDPRVYLDPAVSPAPFVGPIAVKHIPGESQPRFKIPWRLTA